MADDLDPLFLPAPAAPAQDMRYRQGTILSFNPITLENTVRVGGTVVSNLPLLGVGEATLLAPGAIVGITSVLSERGTATWAIIGRMVIPNTTDAFNAISLLSSWVTTNSVQAQETTNSGAYGDLATFGPSVTVTVRQTGRLLLILTAQIQANDLSPLSGAGGAATVEMSGANTVSTATAEATIRLTTFFSINAGTADNLQGTYTTTVVREGMNPGATTITMKYKSTSAGENADIGRRSLTVITL